MSNFIEELKARRSQYVLTSESPVGDQEIVKTVEDVTVQVPSAFNSQPQRAVVLFGDANQKLWNIVKETLRKVVSDDEAFKATEAKINAFAAGHGTVLFYDDTDVTKQLQKNFPTYAANFPGFARRHAAARRVDRARREGAWRIPAALQPADRRGGRRRIRSAVQLGAAGADAVRHRRPGRGSG